MTASLRVLVLLSLRLHHFFSLITFLHIPFTLLFTTFLRFLPFSCSFTSICCRFAMACTLNRQDSRETNEKMMLLTIRFRLSPFVRPRPDRSPEFTVVPCNEAVSRLFRHPQPRVLALSCCLLAELNAPDFFLTTPLSGQPAYFFLLVAGTCCELACRQGRHLGPVTFRRFGFSA